MSNSADPVSLPTGRFVAFGALLFVFALGGVIGVSTWFPQDAVAQGEPKIKSPPPRDEDDPPVRKLAKAPELNGGIAWLNTGKPITMKELKGKVVLLDFWTLCCINCIHIMPDLAKLEKKYDKELVVIGVHSAKFDNEKNSESIRKAILRYDIKHPVVNDADMKIWNAFDVHSWPTLVLIDREGVVRGVETGVPDEDSFTERVEALLSERAAGPQGH